MSVIGITRIGDNFGEGSDFAVTNPLDALGRFVNPEERAVYAIAHLQVCRRDTHPKFAGSLPSTQPRRTRPEKRGEKLPLIAAGEDALLLHRGACSQLIDNAVYKVTRMFNQRSVPRSWSEVASCRSRVTSCRSGTSAPRTLVIESLRRENSAINTTIKTMRFSVFLEDF